MLNPKRRLGLLIFVISAFQNFLAPKLWSLGNISAQTILQKIQEGPLTNRYVLQWEDVQFLLDQKSTLAPQVFLTEYQEIPSALEKKFAAGKLKAHFYTFFVYVLTDGKSEAILNRFLSEEFTSGRYSSLFHWYLTALHFWIGGPGETPRRLGLYFKHLNPIGHTRLFGALADLTEKNPNFLLTLLSDPFFKTVVTGKITEYEKKYKAVIRKSPKSRSSGRAKNGLKELNRFVQNLNELDSQFLAPSSELIPEKNPGEVQTVNAKAQSQLITVTESPNTPPAKPTALEKYLEIYNIVHFELPFMESDDRYMAELEAAERAAFFEVLGESSPLGQAVSQRLGTEGITACMAVLREVIVRKKHIKF